MHRKPNENVCQECLNCDNLKCPSVYMDGGCYLVCTNGDYGIRKDFKNNICCCTGERVLTPLNEPSVQTKNHCFLEIQ